MSAVETSVQSTQYVDFWNEILVPKFIKYKHILVDGLTHHSEAIFPSLPVKDLTNDPIFPKRPRPHDIQGRASLTFAMIKLTRLNNSQILVNPDLIEHVELNTDTVVTLTTGTSFIVKEHAEEILELIVEFKRSLFGKLPVILDGAHRD